MCALVEGKDEDVKEISREEINRMDQRHQLRTENTLKELTEFVSKNKRFYIVAVAFDDKMQNKLNQKNASMELVKNLTDSERDAGSLMSTLVGVRRDKAFGVSAIKAILRALK